MAKPREQTFELHPDRSGIVWDLLLYVPTVAFLIFWGLTLWYGKEMAAVGYVLMFLGFFFLMVGGGRVLRRLQWLPSAPVTLEVTGDRVRVRLKSGETVSLVRDVRYFPDYAGKSFGLSGRDTEGSQRQFVFHRAQFGDEAAFKAAAEALAPYKS